MKVSFHVPAYLWWKLVLYFGEHSLYWTDEGSGSIGWINIDTFQTQVLITSGQPTALLYGLTVFQVFIIIIHWIFESDYIQSKIYNIVVRKMRIK